MVPVSWLRRPRLNPHGDGSCNEMAINSLKSTMETSANQARNLRPAISKIVMALAVASVMGGITISSALGQDNDSRARAGQDRGRNDDRDRNDNRDRNNDRDQREDRPVYVQPYYSE